MATATNYRNKVRRLALGALANSAFLVLLAGLATTSRSYGDSSRDASPTSDAIIADGPSSNGCSLEVAWEGTTKSLPCTLSLFLVRVKGDDGGADLGLRLMASGSGTTGTDLSASVDLGLLSSRIGNGLQARYDNGGSLLFWKATLARPPWDCTTITDAHGTLTVSISSVRRFTTSGQRTIELHGEIVAEPVCVVAPPWTARLRLRF